jgi:hypothetical protein
VLTSSNSSKRFKIESCKPSKLPMDSECQLSKKMGTQPVDPQFYCSLVGSLIYITNTRLDICFVVSSVSRFMDAPEQAHLQLAKQILQYLKGTVDFALHLKSWGEDTRRSTSCLLYKFRESSIY